jgi:hypothetical protein
MNLTDDGWALVGLHLKPRHLFKLILTCKRIGRAVDTERYWTRVAAHLVWRGKHHMELASREFSTEDDLLAPVDEAHNLFYLVGLDCGYYHGMELFLQRMQDTIDAYSRQRYDHCRWWWSEFNGVPSLRDRTVKMYMDGQSSSIYSERPLAMVGDERTIDMKELARRVTVQDWMAPEKSGARNNWAKMRQFVCDLEDDPMPSVYKRRVLGRLNKLVWSMVDVRGGELDASQIVDAICIF